MGAAVADFECRSLELANYAFSLIGGFAIFSIVGIYTLRINETGSRRRAGADLAPQLQLAAAVDRGRQPVPSEFGGQVLGACGGGDPQHRSLEMVIRPVMPF